MIFGSVLTDWLWLQGAWEEANNDCAPEETWTCQQTQKNAGGATDDVICECDGAGAAPAGCAVPSPPVAHGPQPGGHAVWTSANSPVVATGHVNVAQLLAVEPGVRGLFAGGSGLTVNGALLAEGRPEASIEFGSHQESADCAPWSGVTVATGSRGALLRHVWLVGATTALTVAGDAPVVVERCAFDDWQTAAVQYASAGALTIRQTSFGLSSSFGALAAITPTVVTGTGAAAAVVIEHCVFAGRFADADSTITPGPTIRSNMFQNDDTAACALQAPGPKINEIVASQDRFITDRSGQFEDYIELFNPSDSELDLTGYTLLGDDNGSGCDDPLLLTGLKIAARGFLIVWADDDRYQGLNHAPFKLAKHGETIRLYDGTGTEVETVTYPALEDNQAYGRSGDGCGAWAVLDGASPALSLGQYVSRDIPGDSLQQIRCS